MDTSSALRSSRIHVPELCWDARVCCPQPRSPSRQGGHPPILATNQLSRIPPHPSRFLPWTLRLPKVAPPPPSQKPAVSNSSPPVPFSNLSSSPTSPPPFSQSHPPPQSSCLSLSRIRSLTSRSLRKWFLCSSWYLLIGEREKTLTQLRKFQDPAKHASQQCPNLFPRPAAWCV